MAAPVSPAAGYTGDKTFWDNEVYNDWTALYASWTAYTPTWSCSVSAPSLGNGTLTGAYKATGKTVEFRLRWVAGSTTTYGSGLWSFSLPTGYAPTAVQSAPGIAINGAANLRYALGCYLSTGTGIFRMAVNGTSGVKTTTDTPFTWSSGAQIVLGGVYEAS